jgi:hypothetical protein
MERMDTLSPLFWARMDPPPVASTSTVFVLPQLYLALAVLLPRILRAEMSWPGLTRQQLCEQVLDGADVWKWRKEFIGNKRAIKKTGRVWTMLGDIIDSYDGNPDDAERALPLPNPGEGNIVQWSTSIMKHGTQLTVHANDAEIREQRDSCVALVIAWRKALQMRFQRSTDTGSWESVQAELNLHLKTLKPNFSNNPFLDCDVDRVRAEVLQMGSWQLHRTNHVGSTADTGVSPHPPWRKLDAPVLDAVALTAGALVPEEGASDNSGEAYGT